MSGSLKNETDTWIFLQKSRVLDDTPCKSKKHQWEYSKHAGHIRIQMREEADSSDKPKKGHSEKCKIKYVDHPIDALTSDDKYTSS